jgi:2-oxoisovalerate dehydrogenase E1 component beta subunit
MATRTLIEAINEGLREEMARDQGVVALGEDVGLMGGVFRATDGLQKAFGEERAIDAPLAEAAIIGVAIGMSLNGLRPVAEIQFADFISCGFDQIVNFAAKCRYRWNAPAPIVVRAPCGGGIHGGPFHSQQNEAWFTHTPGLKVVLPATARDAKGLIKSAIRDNDPVIFYEHKALYRRLKEDVPGDPSYTVPIGKANVFRQGRHLSIITYSAMVHVAAEVAAKLEKEGLSIEIIDLRTLTPLDEETILESVRKTSKAIVLHEANLTGGFGGEIAARITEKAFEYLDGPVLRVAAPDVPVPFSPTLEEAYLPNAGKLEDKVRWLAAY